MTAHGDGVSFWELDIILELVVMFAKTCSYTKDH